MGGVTLSDELQRRVTAQRRAWLAHGESPELGSPGVSSASCRPLSRSMMAKSTSMPGIGSSRAAASGTSARGLSDVYGGKGTAATHRKGGSHAASASASAAHEAAAENLYDLASSPSTLDALATLRQMQKPRTHMRTTGMSGSPLAAVLASTVGLGAGKVSSVLTTVAPPRTSK